ncbi:hypothetical protein K435DRAFT_854325 [Dendrothele bispora CBS 962.96]|uniref:Uncharacterized protein n=1 Tax=Dendrothele bispora (strain CBS 962.96) TaxID=1314807 RepID=A0A4S8MEA5_DENBC|nr:hypothetical protein K435DRAFT_854325 [Dendrothele bispora CBS 962.96]
MRHFSSQGIQTEQAGIQDSLVVLSGQTLENPRPFGVPEIGTAHNTKPPRTPRMDKMRVEIKKQLISMLDSHKIHTGGKLPWRTLFRILQEHNCEIENWPAGTPEPSTQNGIEKAPQDEIKAVYRALFDKEHPLTIRRIDRRFGGADRTFISRDTTDDPEAQTTSATVFDNSHGHDADLFNHDGAHQTSDDTSGPRGNVEQENERINADLDIENTHDTVVNIDLDLYSTDAETPNGAPSRQHGSISGGYTEQDNRRIDRNFESVGTYHNTEIVNNDGNFKALFVGGLLTGSGFYAGHATAQVEVVHNYHLEPALPGNNALAIIYPRSMDQVPSFVLTFMVLPTVMGNLFSFIRHTVFGRV